MWMPAYMGPLALNAWEDGAGHGWVEIWLGAGVAPSVGFHVRKLHVCPLAGTCQPMVLGVSSGASLLSVRTNSSAESIEGACPRALGEPCIWPPNAPGEPAVLLTTLRADMRQPLRHTVAGSSRAMVCLGEGWSLPASGGAVEPLVHGPLCTPLVAPSSSFALGLAPPPAPSTSIQANGRRRRAKRRKVRRSRAFVAPADPRPRVQLLILSSPGETNFRRRCYQRATLLALCQRNERGEPHGRWRAVRGGIGQLRWRYLVSKENASKDVNVRGMTAGSAAARGTTPGARLSTEAERFGDVLFVEQPERPSSCFAKLIEGLRRTLERARAASKDWRPQTLWRSATMMRGSPRRG